MVWSYDLENKESASPAATLRTPNLPEEDESILEENGNTRIHDFALWKVTDLKVRNHV